jgi:hypothetical protein
LLAPSARSRFPDFTGFSADLLAYLCHISATPSIHRNMKPGWNRCAPTATGQARGELPGPIWQSSRMRRCRRTDARKRSIGHPCPAAWGARIGVLSIAGFGSCVGRASSPARNRAWPKRPRPPSPRGHNAGAARSGSHSTAVDDRAAGWNGRRRQPRRRLGRLSVPLRPHFRSFTMFPFPVPVSPFPVPTMSPFPV